MSVSVKRFFLFCFISLTTGLTSFRLYQSGSSTELSSTFSYSLLQGSKVSVEGATNVNEFTCFSNETYSQHSANLSINDLKNNITFHNVILNVETESLQCGN